MTGKNLLFLFRNTTLIRIQGDNSYEAINNDDENIEWLTLRQDKIWIVE